MWRRKIKEKISQIISSPKTFFVVSIIVLGLLIMPLSKNIKDRFSINKEIGDLESQISKTQNKNQDLQKLISYLGSDQYVEEQARENLGMMKSGEQVVVVKGLPDTAQKTTPQEKEDNRVFIVPGLDKAQAKETISNPQRWVAYFFKRQ